MASRRIKRVSSLIKEEIGGMIQRGEVPSGSCILTVTEVRLSGDLKNAKVFVSAYGEQEEADKSFKVLAGAGKKIRKLLYATIRLRYIPELEFIKDDSIAEGSRILNIFSELEKEKLDDPD